ncbi:unnamed protein product, partial [Iphiclides podalirius]
MPGAGSIDVRSAYLRLIDGLLALYHGAAIKHAEKLCELRDSQLDLADCLHDIEQRMASVSSEMQAGVGLVLTEEDKVRKQLMERMLKELERSKAVYEEKLVSGALQMAWVVGAIWTKQRQQELAKHFAGTLYSLRLSSDPEYATHIEVASKEILPGKSSLLGNSSYASLQLEYTSSSDQSPQSQASQTATPRQSSGAHMNILNPHNGQAGFAESLFAFVPEYHVDAMLELCNTLRLYMHPTVPIHQIAEWDELMVSCAGFLCAEFADQRIVLASTRESLVQTLASFATQPSTMRAIEKVPIKQQMCMVEELVRPYQNRAWAQSNWVLVRFWHGSGFGFRHRQWPHLAAKFGDREPTVNNLGAKVDAGLMSQCFGPCPSEVIQSRVRDYLLANPKEAASFLNSLLSQLNWAFSEFITMMQEMDRVHIDANLEPRQIKLCATCFDLYHGLARALEMTLHLVPTMLTKPEVSDNQNDLLLGRTCQHLQKVTKVIVNEPLFRIDGLEFMLGKSEDKRFSFYNYPDDVTVDELKSLEAVIGRLRVAREAVAKISSPGSSGTQSDLLCTICYARPADTAFMPCGHHSCRPCIMQHLLNSKQCFFCKADIESVREIEPLSN